MLSLQSKLETPVPHSVTGYAVTLQFSVFQTTCVVDCARPISHYFACWGEEKLLNFKRVATQGHGS